VAGQLKIDFEYDDRLPKLALEVGIMLAPHLAPGTTRETTSNLAARVVKLAAQRLARHEEPAEEIRCHSCDAPTKSDERARVVVCVRCGLRGGSPGSGG
jgi:predicted lipoprotein